MENRTDIWHHLKDQETVPPPGLYQGLLHKLDTVAQDHAADHETMENRATFQKLMEHAIPPPSDISADISSAIASAAKPNRPRRNKPYKLLLSYTAAASILLIVFGAFFYRTSYSASSPSAHPTGPATLAKSPAATATVRGDSARTTITDHPTAANPSAANPSAANATAALPSRQAQLSLAVDNNRITLVDNNILATFTDYKYPALRDYVREEKEDVGIRIHLDQYTDISLSPAMTATLRMLYGTRPDGSLDRKARKTKEKLQKWEAEDNKQFDPRYASNPLDPIDLAEFIFPPLISFGWHSGPAALPSPARDNTAAGDSAETKLASAHAPVTISYSITLSTKRSTGIAETYNGGIQTLFAAGDQARLRLASLMRIESLFLIKQTITILAESTKPQFKTVLAADQWERYNSKYAGATCDLGESEPDSADILGYSCKKAVIKLHDGRRITAWYTPRITEPAQAILQPEFARIPGLVLRYEYTCRHKTVCYTATSLSRQSIDPSVFNISSTP